MELTKILSLDAVYYTQKETSKKRLFQDISEKAANLYDLEASDIFAALNAREELGATGVGRGVAIPHARFAKLDHVVGLFTRLEKPMDYGSTDRQAVDIVFTLLAPENSGAEHLKALALVSRTLRNAETCTKLRSNHDAQSIFSILTETKTVKAA
ncbi:MAG: PTS lactose transporter subunit IIC [Rhodobacteraceae bacterium]|nr:MAG: PTS lactose transporter subunit IIC [Paracoccaceae bacterium]